MIKFYDDVDLNRHDITKPVKTYIVSPSLRFEMKSAQRSHIQVKSLQILIFIRLNSYESINSDVAPSGNLLQQQSTGSSNENTDIDQRSKTTHNGLARLCSNPPCVVGVVFAFVTVVTVIHWIVVPPAHKSIISPLPADPNAHELLSGPPIDCTMPAFDPANYHLHVHQITSDLSMIERANEHNRAFLPADLTFHTVALPDTVEPMKIVSNKLKVCAGISGVFEAFSLLRPVSFRTDLYRVAHLWDTGGLWMDDKVHLTQPFTTLNKTFLNEVTSEV